MAYDCDYAKTQLYNNYWSAQQTNDSAYLWLIEAKIDWNAGADHAAIGHILTACDQFYYAIRSLYGRDDNLDPEYYAPYLWEHCSGVVTAISICEAWAKAQFQERALTIAYIDRMRQLIWDEPFYVAWAARPESEND